MRGLIIIVINVIPEMRWFRGHAEAPKLLSLSPLQADEDLDGASYHFHAASQYRGKNREKTPIQLPHCLHQDAT